MFLIKCKCGSMFTLNKNWNTDRALHCPNCKASIGVNAILDLQAWSNATPDTESACCIPDSAKITVTFDT